MLEDEEDLVEYLPPILKDKGLEVIGTTSITEALELLAKEPFDVVLLDIKMPPAEDMGGEQIDYRRGPSVEVARRMKAIKPEVPIIALTMMGDPDSQVQKQVIEALEKLKFQEAAPETSRFVELREQINKLMEEIKGLRKELREAITRLAPQPDEYARQVLEEGRRNLEAYEREEPELIKKYSGQFAVFCDGELVAVGPDRREVLRKAIQARPEARPYVRQVGEKIPTIPAGRR